VDRLRENFENDGRRQAAMISAGQYKVQAGTGSYRAKYSSKLMLGPANQQRRRENSDNQLHIEAPW